MHTAAFRINVSDTVATMLESTPGGAVQLVGGSGSIVATEPIDMGHKIAIVAMQRGDAVIKFGVPIGVATEDIHPGQWVHLHNCRSQIDERSNTFDVHTGESSDIPYA